MGKTDVGYSRAAPAAARGQASVERRHDQAAVQVDRGCGIRPRCISSRRAGRVRGNEARCAAYSDDTSGHQQPDPDDYRLAPVFLIGPAMAHRCRVDSHSSSVARRACPGRLKQEPGSSFRLVDPGFNQASRRNVAMFVTDIVSFPQMRRQDFVVVAKLGDHVERLDITGVVTQCAASSRFLRLNAR